jgi:hypothetical protein
MNRTVARLAYADPPYLGYSKYYDHPEAAIWDDLTSHADLLSRLDSDFDGWAYSCTSTTLAVLLPHAPECTRIAAWVKPFAAFKRNVRIAYTWEPVLFKPGRDSSKLGAPVGRDHLAESITLKRGLTGVKPDKFNRWVLDLLGYIDGDDVTDLFPGSHGMARAINQGVLNP